MGSLVPNLGIREIWDIHPLDIRIVTFTGLIRSLSTRIRKLVLVLVVHHDAPPVPPVTSTASSTSEHMKNTSLSLRR